MTNRNNNDEKTLEIKSIKSINKAKSADSKEPKNNKKKSKHSPFFKQRIVASVLIFITVIGIAVASTLVVHTLKLADGEQFQSLTQESFTSQPSSTFLDVNNEAYHSSALKYRTNISYDDLSTSLIDAFVAAEDSRFFEHNGFDIPRFTMALINNVFRSIKAGSLVLDQGGSTFTMQLIKNTAFTKDGSDGGEIVQAEGGLGGIDRKLVEIYLSQKFESEGLLSKKLILELYLNKIDFGVGNNTVGIENSARAYFGKSASELNTVESAFMAAVINGPFIYSPYHNIKLANEETQRVVYNMHYHGYISDEEYALAQNVKIEDLLVENDSTDGEVQPYQSYIDLVYDEVIELTGESPHDTPMIVHTSLNPEVQEELDRVQNREIDSLDMLSVSEKSIQQVASTVLNNKTGEIVGTVGRYDYTGQRISNLATKRLGSPGSILKPILVYAPAYENLGWASDHIITDEPYMADVTSVKNYDGRHLGQITLSDAITDSRNVPAVKAFQEVSAKIGKDAYVQYLKDVGLIAGSDEVVQNIEDNFGWGYAIGNEPLNVNTVQMAGSTAVLFNEGKYVQPHTVTKIEYLDGRKPLVPDYEAKEVLSPGAAYLTAQNMREVVQAGGYPGVLRRSYPTYAKTGTVEADSDQSSEYNLPQGAGIHRLMITSTSDFTIATWNGFEKMDKEKQTYFSDAEKNFNLPGNLNSFILDVIEDSYGAGGSMEQPGDVVSLTHIKGFFPYQSPLDNMNPDLISTGKILKKHATLTSATPQTLAALNNQTVTATQSGKTLQINVDMTAYPDADKLEEAKDTMEMTDPKYGSKYSGKRLYDETWIYGAVRYKTDIKINGTIVEEVTTDKNKHSVAITLPNNASSVEVCSYYTFDKAKTNQSNQKCSKIDISKQGIEVPDFIGQAVGLVMNWASSNGMPEPNVTYQQASNQFGTVLKISPNISGQSLTKDQLANTQLTLTVADTRISSNITVRQFKEQFGGLITISNQGSLNDDSVIAGYQFDGNSVNSFMLSTRLNKEVTILI